MSFDDRMIERDLEEALGNDGPSPGLRERLLAATGVRTGARSASEGSVASPVADDGSHPGKVVAMRPRRITAQVQRRSSAPVWIAAAAALVLALGIVGLAIQPKKGPDALAGGNQSIESPRSPSGAGTANLPAEKAPKASGNQSATEPGNSPAPAPKGEPIEPQPEPLPVLPQPEPKPAPVPKPGPEPAPPKPDDVVEKPKPEPKPDGTEVKPEPAPQPRQIAATLLGADKIKARGSDTEEWVDFKGGDVTLGLQLKAARAAELRLADGALLRFEGELVLHEAGGTMQAVLLARRSELYLDNAGCKAAVQILAGDLECSALGAIHAEHDGNAILLACYEGRVDHGAQHLVAGHQAKLNEKGLGKAGEVKPPRPSLVRNAGLRVLARGDFEDQGGAAKVAGPNADVAAPLGEFVVLAGATLKLRYRVKGGKALYVQLQKTAGDIQYGKWVPLAKVGEWQELEVPLAELARDDGKGEGMPVIGEVIRTLRVFVQDGEAPELEIDWYEISRRAN